MFGKKIEQSISSGELSTNLVAGRDIHYYSNSKAPIKLIDSEIRNELTKLLKGRFFGDFPSTKIAVSLGQNLCDGVLASGSEDVRLLGLSWCARILSVTEEFDAAKKFLASAQELGSSDESLIAEAFISSKELGKHSALKTLSELDSDASHTARLMIVSHSEGQDGALGWLKLAGLGVDDLDAYGKEYLLLSQLEGGLWDDAFRTVENLVQSDFEKVPFLHYLAAFVKLALATPIDFREEILTQVPFQASEFPLSSTPDALQLRKEAHHHFIVSARVSEELNCSESSRICGVYGLWLELRDPQLYSAGLDRLKCQLGDLKSGLGVVFLAVQYGLKVDLDTVEREIDRSFALNGTVSTDAAFARLAIAFCQPDEESAANYVEKYYSQLSEKITPKSLRTFQLEMHLRIKAHEKASITLQHLRKLGLSPQEEEHLTVILGDIGSETAITSRLMKYESTKSITDLINLVSTLEQQKSWEELCKFGEILFEETKSVNEAERLVQALSATGRDAQIVRFLRKNSHLLTQSDKLAMFLAWGLYHEGEFIESRSELNKIDSKLDVQNYRALKLNLAIATGDHSSLTAHVVEEFSERHNLSAKESLKLAQLAMYIDSPLAKQLLFESAGKAGQDAEVLAAAYFMATNEGWESDPAVYGWLEKAAELSGEDGPIQQLNIQDLLAQKPEWDRVESETYKLLAHGEVPIFLAANSLRKKLVDMTMFPALANTRETDLRHKGLISAFSGSRKPSNLDIEGKAIAFDSTSLLTLAFLDVLDVTFDFCTTIHLPHSTLNWLYEEQKNAAFHQPSRIKNAHALRDLVARDSIERLNSNSAPDGELSDEVGYEKALLISEAMRQQSSMESQSLVVLAGPVHKISSFMNVEADLSAYSSVLCGCLPLVQKLRQKGQITSEEEKRARSYLVLHETPWKEQPEIQDDATLYIDRVVVTHLSHLGLLDKLSHAGFKVIISPDVVAEANALISYENLSSDVKGLLERVIFSLSSRIQSGDIKVMPSVKPDRIEEAHLGHHPTLSLITSAPLCDGVVVDDRFVNQHKVMDVKGCEICTFTTLDVLDSLLRSEVISLEEWLEKRTKLRKAGYSFVPISIDELKQCLERSEVKEEELIEAAELKAIRESILKVRMSDWLKHPEETTWLYDVFMSFTTCIKRSWLKGDIEKAAACSDWLLKQIDIRGWVQNLSIQTIDEFIPFRYGSQLILLFLNVDGIEGEARDNYWKWLECRVLTPLKVNDPDIFSWLVDWFIGYFTKTFMEGVREELSKSDSPAPSNDLFIEAFLNSVPPLLRSELDTHPKVLDLYQSKIVDFIVFGHDEVSFEQSVFLESIQKLLDQEFIKLIDVVDTKKKVWQLKKVAPKEGGGCFELHKGERKINLPNFNTLSSDKETRLSALKSASKSGLSESAQEKWRKILEQRALYGKELSVFQTEQRSSFKYISESIQAEVNTRQFSNSTLVPLSMDYYEQLIGKFDGSKSITEYVSNEGGKHFAELAQINAYDGFLRGLLLCSCADMSEKVDLDKLSEKDLLKALSYIETTGDVISIIGAIEVVARVCSETSEALPYIRRFIKRVLEDLQDEDKSQFKLFSGLFVLVEGEFARTGFMKKYPPFYRKLASMAQAGLLQRCISKSGLNTKSVIEWAYHSNAKLYYMQAMADMPQEPLWNPDMISNSHLRYHAMSRILDVCVRYEVLGDFIEVFKNEEHEFTVLKMANFLFPSPVEGTECRGIELPESLDEILRKALESQEISELSFIPLTNIANGFRFSSVHAELIVKTLERIDYKLNRLHNTNDIAPIVNGLAHVAASSRNQQLAQSLWFLVRRYRRDQKVKIRIDEVLRICLIASAAFTDRNEWESNVGEWISELAFGELSSSEAMTLSEYLSSLLCSRPELRLYCSRAEAAVQSVI